MEALGKALRSSEVGPPLCWGAGCGAVAGAHGYASLFAHVPKRRTRILRSIDVGVIIFVVSASLKYFSRPDAPSLESTEQTADSL